MLRVAHVYRQLAILAACPLLCVAAVHPCAGCHAKQVRGYQRTGMANSLFRPDQQLSGTYTHALSGTAFRISTGGASMRQRMERNGFTADYPVDFVIGSGNHAFGYLIRIGDYLFQSPLAYYSKRGSWGLAPGYERDREPDFGRPVTEECLVCHSGRPLAVAGTLNRYREPIFAEPAISCDRCHGPVDAHLAAPSARNIVNPAKLPPRARDSVCEQCHLGGEARIPNPGHRIAEFRPGQELEEVFSVYVFDAPPEAAGRGGLKVVSHVEQLALSTCARRSGGKMWCGTCHAPHHKPEEPKAYYRAKCAACHGAALAAGHPAPAGDCIGCHMPRRPAKDGGHTAFTDHRIARVPQPGEGPVERRALRAWREPPPLVASRNLGLADVMVGERDESAPFMEQGFRLLTEVYESSPNDPALLTSMGLVILRKGGRVEAARLYEKAIRLDPNYAPYHINAATAWKEAGDPRKAIAHLEKAIAMDPSLELAYRNLSEVYLQIMQPEKAREALKRYLAFMPGNIGIRTLMDTQ